MTRRLVRAGPGEFVNYDGSKGLSTNFARQQKIAYGMAAPDVRNTAVVEEQQQAIHDFADYSGGRVIRVAGGWNCFVGKCGIASRNKNMASLRLRFTSTPPVP